MISTIILIAFVLLCLILYKKFGFWETTNHHLRSPPVVPGSLPLIGHLLYLGGQPAKSLMKWGKKYGKMFMVNLGPLKALVIDDPVLMKDILNQPVFSGRLQNEMFMLMSNQGHGLLFSEGKTWESQRKFTIKHLRDFGIKKQYMENLLLNEAKELISTFEEHLEKPLLIKHTFLLPVLNGLWILTTGEKLPQQDTRLLEIWTEWITSFNNCLTTGVMFAPELRHVAPSPLGWNRFVAANDAFTKFIEETVTQHIETFDDTNHRDLIDSFISEIEKTTDVDSPFYKETGYTNLSATVADIFIAGSETTSTTLNWAILYLIANPDIQEKLHEEIICVIGAEKSPSLSDRPKMPYTEATVCEVLRMASFAPMGLIQRALHDTDFDGFFIKKGTLIMGNIYSAHYNPDHWNEPEIFRPERFLSSSGEKIKNPPQFIPFEVGRRQCLGESYAMDNMFLFISSIFQNLLISPYEKDQNLDFETIPGFTRTPKPFKVKITRRC